MPGRRPLPSGQARTVKLYTRVREAAANEFRRICAKRGVTESEALRQALTLWIERKP